MLASIIGLSVRTVERRLAAVHGNTRIEAVFRDEWPIEKPTLGILPVEMARRAVLDIEVVHATGLGLREVRRRLETATERTSLNRVFPELALKHRKNHRQAEVKANDDMEYDTWRQYSVRGAKFSVIELLGEARTVSIRNAPKFLDWFAGIVGLERRAIQQMLSAYHGHGNVRRVFSKYWPAQLESMPREVLGAFSAEATRRSPALIRLVADMCNLKPQTALERLMGARRNDRTDQAVPELLRVG